MDWLRTATIASLIVVAVAAGGTAVRLAVAAEDPRAALVAGLVVVLVLGAVAAGARDRRWRRNPYW